jgi:hypothetical protein
MALLLWNCMCFFKGRCSQSLCVGASIKGEQLLLRWVPDW